MLSFKKNQPASSPASNSNSGIAGMLKQPFYGKDGGILPLRIILRDWDFERQCLSPTQGGGKYSSLHDSILGGLKNCRYLSEGEIDRRFNLALLGLVTEKEQARKLRQYLICIRQLEPDERDTTDFQQKVPNFLQIVDAFPFSERRRAELITLLFPEASENIEATYLISAKILTGRVGFTPNGGIEQSPIQSMLRIIREMEGRLNSLEPSKQGTAKAILQEGMNEAFLQSFSGNPEDGFSIIDSHLQSAGNLAAELLGRTKKYYSEISGFNVEGIVGTLSKPGNPNPTPYPSIHQKIGVKKILDEFRVLIADEMGVGKTAQSIISFIELLNREPEANHKALVICPALSVKHWQDELAKILAPEKLALLGCTVIGSGDASKKVQQAKNSKFVIISYDMLIRSFNGSAGLDAPVGQEGGESTSQQAFEAKKILAELKCMGFTHVTIDEVHHAKNPSFIPKKTVVAGNYRELCKDGQGKRMLVAASEEELADLELGLQGELLRMGFQKMPLYGIVNGNGVSPAGLDIVLATHDTAKSLSGTEKFDKVVNYGDLDEYAVCQRAAAANDITKNAKYLVLLSGTPLPARMDDLRNLASMLEPKKYPTPLDFNPNDVAAVKELFGKHMIRRLTKQVMDMPPLEISHTMLEPSDLQRQAYQLIQENEIGFNGSLKLMLGRLAAIDPQGMANKLLNNYDEIIASCHMTEVEQVEMLNELISLAAKSPSAKFDYLAQKLKEHKAKGEKAVVFSSVLKDGVMDGFMERLAAEGISALRVDGDTGMSGADGGERERIRKAFQSKDGPDALFAMLDCMRETVELTAATKVYFLDYPYTWMAASQGFGRVWRRHQTKKIGVEFLQIRGTIDTPGQQLMEERNKLSQYIIDGIPLTESERSRVMSADLAKFGEQGTPAQQLNRLIGAMSHRGSSFNMAFLGADDSKYAKLYADLYQFNLESSYPADMGRALRNLSLAIESSSGKEFKSIVDLGSGPGMFSRFTGKRTTCVDINKFQLEKAKQALGNMVDTIHAPMHSVPLADESQDLAVLSLSIHYSLPIPTNSNVRSEREEVFREVARMLKPGGHMLLSLPTAKVDEKGIARLIEGLEQLGFEVSMEHTGFVSAPGSQFKAFVLDARRTGQVLPLLPLDPGFFFLSSDWDVRDIGASRRRGRKEGGENTSRGFNHQEFVLEDLQHGVHALAANPNENGKRAQPQKAAYLRSQTAPASASSREKPVEEVPQDDSAEKLDEDLARVAKQALDEGWGMRRQNMELTFMIKRESAIRKIMQQKAAQQMAKEKPGEFGKERTQGEGLQ